MQLLGVMTMPASLAAKFDVEQAPAVGLLQRRRVGPVGSVTICASRACLRRTGGLVRA